MPADDAAPLSPERLAALRAWLRQPESPGPCPVCGAERIDTVFSPNNGIRWLCRAQFMAGPGRDPAHYRASFVEILKPSITQAELVAQIDRLTADLTASRARADRLLQAGNALADEAEVFEEYSSVRDPDLVELVERWRAVADEGGDIP